MKLLRILFAGVALNLAIFSAGAAAQDDPFTKRAPAPIVGRWDLKMRDGGKEYPSWIEVKLSGFRTLVGTYVGQFGSARPISEVSFDAATGAFRFSLPPQWERRTNNIVVEGKFEGDRLTGETTNDKGSKVTFEGKRAPSLDRAQPPRWREAQPIFNGKDLTGWTPRNSAMKNGWKVQDGILVNAEPGNDLVTDQTFNDFKLKADFRYPKKSNSGIYLRGRYEVQIEDNFALPPDSHYIGGVYGFLTPRVNVGKQAGEWQDIELTLVGRVLTVVLNGEPVIERQAIPGITGGALDSDEDKPGPMMLQGDHGPVEFRTLVLTPAE